MTLYKVLGEKGEAVNGGRGKWSLPRGNKPGAWMPPIEGELRPCENGYHLVEEKDLLDWIGPRIFEAEYRGERVDAGVKVVVREARLLREFKAWNEKTARLFACDCAEWALSLVERPAPRSVEAVRVARAFALGRASRKELAAAWDASWAASWDASWVASWAAALAASWDAARDAARSAAASAARYAAEAAAREYMTERLMQYLRGEATR